MLPPRLFCTFLNSFFIIYLLIWCSIFNTKYEYACISINKMWGSRLCIGCLSVRGFSSCMSSMNSGYFKYVYITIKLSYMLQVLHICMPNEDRMVFNSDTKPEAAIDRWLHSYYSISSSSKPVCYVLRMHFDS